MITTQQALLDLDQQPQPMTSGGRGRGGRNRRPAGSALLQRMTLAGMMSVAFLGFVACEDQTVDDDATTIDETYQPGDADGGMLGDPEPIDPVTPTTPPIETTPPPRSATDPLPGAGAERPGQGLPGGGMDEGVGMTEERTITVSLSAPDTAWSVNIEEVYLTADNVLAVVARLERPEGVAGATMISTIEDSVTVDAPADAVVRVAVIGKDWNWENTEVDYNFVDSFEEIGDDLENAERIYQFDPNNPDDEAAGGGGGGFGG